MKTLVRYSKGGTVYVQNGEYTLQPYDKTKAVRCCKHGITEKGEGGTLTITEYSQNVKGVYCALCVMDLLDREIGRIN